MPTFKVQLYGEYDRATEKHVKDIVVIEADRMQVVRYGDLGFMKGTRGGRDCLVQVFSTTQWERAWEVAEEKAACQ